MQQPVIPKGKHGLAMSSMINKVFFDTNILVYAADRHSPEKQHIARNALRAAAQSHTGVISTQVLQEFYVVATRLESLGLNYVRTM